jgi:hypothetical protein
MRQRGELVFYNVENGILDLEWRTTTIDHRYLSGRCQTYFARPATFPYKLLPRFFYP